MHCEALSNATNVANAFYNCESLSGEVSSSFSATGVRLPSNFNSVTTADSMFAGCKSITRAVIQNMGNAAKCSFEGMFRESGLTILELTNIGNSSDSIFHAFASNCASLETVVIENCAGAQVNTTSNVVTDSMFSGCSSLNNVRINNFLNGIDNRYNIGSGYYYHSNDFAGCPLRNITITNSYNGTGQKLNNLFSGAFSINYASETQKPKLTLSNVGNGANASLHYMLSGCSNLYSVNMSNVGNGTNPLLGAMFVNCYALTKATLNNVGNGANAEMARMFINCGMEFQ